MKTLRNHALSSYQLYKFLKNLDIGTDKLLCIVENKEPSNTLVKPNM
jgi:hypothetical protein